MSVHDDRQHQLLRLLQILDGLERGEKLTRRSMAARCGCSARTIARDLAFLQSMGVEIAYDARAVSYKLQSALPFKAIEFNLAEVMALAITKELLQARSGSPFQSTINSAFARIMSRLPAGLRPVVAQTQKFMASDSGLQRDYSQAPWQELAQAARARETVEICYHTLSRDEWNYRRVDPYLLAERGGYMMLVAYCHKRQEVREFALDRIRQLRSIGENFKVAPAFCREEYFRGSINALRGVQTKIRVRFDAALAPYARRRQWQFPHEFEELPDGSLQLHATVSGEKGIRNELLSWGAGFEVIEPASLREALRVEGQAIAEKHRPKMAPPKENQVNSQK
jgi:predicted DNA-binding transcriptional regulator YafY